jgi:hypothetical protein
MTRKSASLLVVLILLIAASVHLFTDWFRPVRIQISSSNRPMPGLPDDATTCPVAFGFDGRYGLTSIEVVSLAEVETNRHAPALWHLVSRSNSVPTRGFTYGQAIGGMQPFDPGRPAQPLQPNTRYRLVVTAGRAHGQVDFVPQAPGEAAP